MTIRHRRVAVFGTLLMTVTLAAAAWAVPEPGAPEGWELTGDIPKLYQTGIDRQIRHSGAASAYIQSDEPGRHYGALMQTFSAERYRNKRMRLRGFVQSDIQKGGWAGLWMRVDARGSSRFIAFDNMNKRAIKGVTGWTEYQVVLDVPDNAHKIALGALLSGVGIIHIDKLIFEEVDSSVPTTGTTMPSRAPEPFNLSFEEVGS